MLSSNIPFNPRPRPPAKLRRSSSQTRPDDLHLNLRAPPPYAPFATNLPTLLGSPITATSQLIRLDEVHEKEESLQEKSKEELEELLRRASEIIRDRERELDLTSETCRTLAQGNASLKSRNDTLIARLPPSQPPSPLTSPSIHGAPLLSPAHSRSSSRSLLSSPKPLSFAQASMRRNRPGHARKMSSTPAELAALADQNAELLAKLADVEEEASRAEQIGKRRLKNLETEIETLRDELERAREESQQLQETVQSAPQASLVRDLEGLPGGLDKQVVKMFKRLSREAKVRELKAKTRPWEQEQDEGPKNFAPDNLTPGLPFTSKIVSRKVSAPNLHIDTALDQPMSAPRLRNVTTPNVNINLPVVDSPISSVSPSATPTIAPNAREQALVSQLLLKIRELEETNAQLEANHLKASIRLREAQTESESVRRLCEFISDEVEGDLDVELEVVQDDDAQDADERQIREFDRATREETEICYEDPSELRSQSNPKVRLRSVSRKASMDFGGNGSSLTRTRRSVRLRKFSSVDSFSFPPPPLESSPPPASIRRAARNGNVNGANGAAGRLKTRKTVLGLFNEEAAGGGNVDDSEASSTLPRTPELSFDQPMPSRMSRRARFPAPSPVLEPLGSPPSVVGLNSDTDTGPVTAIDTETETDADNDTDIDTEEGPSRMQSLGSELGLELEGLRPPPAIGHHTRTKSIMELLHSHDHGHGADSHSPVSSTSALPSSTAMTGSGFRLSPKSTRNQNPTHTHSINSGRKTSGSSDGIACTIAPAPLDERITYPRLRKAKSSVPFGFGLGVGPSWAHNPEGNRNSTAGRHSSANIDTYNGRKDSIRQRNSLSALSPPPAVSPSSKEKTSSSLHQQDAPKNSYERLRALLLELWLWLYFVAVIVVFVFTVARKGPKGVLNAKTSSGSGSASGSRTLVGGRKARGAA